MRAEGDQAVQVVGIEGVAGGALTIAVAGIEEVAGV